jgi:hypothetical protein
MRSFNGLMTWHGDHQTVQTIMDMNDTTIMYIEEK